MRLPPVLKHALRHPFEVPRVLGSDALSASVELALFAQAVDAADHPSVPPAVPSTRVWRPGEHGAVPAATTWSRHPALPDVPGVEAARLRLVARRSRSVDRGRQGDFPSMKMGRTIARASLGERAAMLDCELSGDVTLFCEQPLTLSVHVDGRVRRYTPDLLRVRAGRVELVEVRPERSASLPSNELRWRTVGPQIAAMGVTFLVQTERDLRHTARWERLGAVWRDRHAEAPAGPRLRTIREVVSGLQQCTVGVLVANVPGLSHREVHSAIRHGLLLADFDVDGIAVSLPPLGFAFPKRWGAVP